MDTDLLVSRIRDTADLSIKTQKPKFLGFLTADEAALVKNTLKNIGSKWSLFGGYEDSQRVMLGCFPDWDMDCDFPISPVTFTYREKDELCHRDFLGVLMSLGVKRETVGDILVEKGRAVIFINAEIADYIINQVSKVGNIGVKVQLGYNLPLPKVDKPIDMKETVSSMRIDCVIAAICGLSRSVAAQYVSDGLVTVNSVLLDKPTKAVHKGDVLSVRGKGRFIIDNHDSRTRKDRIILNYKKFI